MSERVGILKRFFLPQYMLRQDQRLGDDYPAGDMYRGFVRLAWPSVTEAVLTGFVSFADTIMVSSCGEEAISAVGLTSEAVNLFFAFFASIGVAVNALVARRYGEKRQEDANRCVAMILPISLAFSMLFMTVSFFVARPLLLFSGAQADTIDLAIPYFNIVMIGLNFTVVTRIINSAQRGCGNTRISMVANLAANVVNIIFNFLLIGGRLGFPALGVTGAAIATLLGNVTAAVIAFSSVLRRGSFLRLTYLPLREWDPEQLRTLLRIGSGSMVEQLFMRVGLFSYSKLVAGLGTIPYATHRSVMSIVNLSINAGTGLSGAAAALVGQNLGRGRPDHSLIYGKIGQRIALGFALVISVSFVLFGRPLMTLFSDTDEVISVGYILLCIVAASAPFAMSGEIYRGCLHGAGDTAYTAVVSLVSLAVVRPLLAYVLCYPLGFGVVGAWIAYFGDHLARFLFAAIRVGGSKWYKKKV